MVYVKESQGSGGYVACIIVNGQPVHERADGVVELPFETDYQIRLRNKTDRGCVAKVYVDEELVTPTGLIVNRNDYVDLDCHVETRRKFRFVAVDSFDAIDHGKNRPNDPSMGVIRVEFFTEKERIRPQPYYSYKYLSGFTDPPGICTNETLTSGSTSKGFVARGLEAGATVDGGHSSQSFTTSYMDVNWSSPTVVRVVLKGYWRDEPSTPVLNRACTKCGANRKRPSAKFCEICGERF